MKRADTPVSLVPLSGAQVQLIRPATVGQHRIADRTLYQMATIYQRIAQKKAQREANYGKAA